MSLTIKQVSIEFSKLMKHPVLSDFVNTARKLIYYDTTAEEYREIEIPGKNPSTGLAWTKAHLAEFMSTYSAYYTGKSKLFTEVDVDLFDSLALQNSIIRAACLTLLDYINIERAEHSRATKSDADFLADIKERLT